MARPTLGTHPKFFRLAALVGGRHVARGVLELIWDSAYASGNAVVGASTFIEATADWRGKAGELTAALVSSGFLDPVQNGASEKHLQLFAVHDLEDHAPDYVLRRWEREAKRQASGETLRSVRQRAAREKWRKNNANEVHMDASVSTPAPAPAQKNKIRSEAKAADGLRIVPSHGDLRAGPDTSGSEARKRRTVVTKTGNLFEPPTSPQPALGPQQVIAWFCEAWKKKNGKTYVPTPADGGQCKAFLKGKSQEFIFQLPEMFARYLGDTDRFIENNAHSLKFFFSQVNKYTPGGTIKTTNGVPIGVHRVEYGKAYEGEAGHYVGDVFYPANQQDKAK